MDDYKAKFKNLSALYLNCTLKTGDEESHTDRLIKVSTGILDSLEVEHETIRVANLDLAIGMKPDMTKHGADKDDWPELYKKVLAADILVIGSPIWLGEKSSVATKLIERLYSTSAQYNNMGQYAYYGRVGGCLVTGNEDGVKHVGMGVLYALQHIGYTVPPQVDAGWIGEVGPGPSYGDGGAGYDNDFTNRNTTFMTWNLLHMASLLKQNDGFPAYGNQPDEWNDGKRFGFQPLMTD